MLFKYSSILSALNILTLSISIIAIILGILQFNFATYDRKTINRFINYSLTFTSLVGAICFVAILYIYHLFMHKYYFYILANNLLFEPSLSYLTDNNYSYEFDSYGIVILFLGNLVGVITKATLDTRLRPSNLNYKIILSYFNLILVYFIGTTNLLDFFLLYEFLLLPSFLIVYKVAYSRRALHASLYFLI